MIYELSRENLELAKQEVLSLAKPKEFKLIGKFLFCKGKFDIKRLAYTHNVYQEIFVNTKIPKVNWEKYYKESFCVRSNIDSKERELAPIVWNSLKNPKVVMKNPKTEFWFFFVDDKIIGCKKIYERQEKFKLRRPDIRPGFFPISLKPKLARAVVNLSGVKKGIIWDPFCGTGGILLEASLMGLKSVGTDIDPIMLRAAKDNFKHYNLKAKFFQADARTEKIKCKAIVTDPPYGRRASTRKSELKDIYEAFLDNAYEFVDTVVIMMPDDLQLKFKYKIAFETTDYVHGSLTRRILVLKRP